MILNNILNRNSLSTPNNAKALGRKKAAPHRSATFVAGDLGRYKSGG